MILDRNEYVHIIYIKLLYIIIYNNYIIKVLNNPQTLNSVRAFPRHGIVQVVLGSAHGLRKTFLSYLNKWISEYNAMSRMSIVERRPFIDNVNKWIVEYFAPKEKNNRRFSCTIQKIFVPLPLLKWSNGEWRLRLSIARASSALRSPCTSLGNRCKPDTN